MKLCSVKRKMHVGLTIFSSIPVTIFKKKNEFPQSSLKMSFRWWVDSGSLMYADWVNKLDKTTELFSIFFFI